MGQVLCAFSKLITNGRTIMGGRVVGHSITWRADLDFRFCISLLKGICFSESWEVASRSIRSRARRPMSCRLAPPLRRGGGDEVWPLHHLRPRPDPELVSMYDFGEPHVRSDSIRVAEWRLRMRSPDERRVLYER